MPKSTKVLRSAPQAEDTQKLYAHTYGVRLAKEVAEQFEGSRRKPPAAKKRGGKA
jgi:hypothetical protein